MMKKCFANKSSGYLKVISVALIVFAIITFILFFCPIYYLQSFEHAGKYYNAFHCLSGDNVWSLILSITFLIITICISAINLFLNSTYKWLTIATFIIYAATIALCITTFALAANTTNLPK